MRSKLNPNGSKIRSLRIQRGWTQDQLADIAGISSRTIQRAETADSAAFETLRAIAGAFETDFDQLLKPDPEALDVIGGHVPTSAVEMEPIAVNPPQSALRNGWVMFLVPLATLLLGVVAGVSLKPHLDIAKKSDVLAMPNISSPLPQFEKSERIPLSGIASLQSQPKKRIQTTKTQLSDQHQYPDGKGFTETLF